MIGARRQCDADGTGNVGPRCNLKTPEAGDVSIKCRDCENETPFATLLIPGGLSASNRAVLIPSQWALGNREFLAGLRVAWGDWVNRQMQLLRGMNTAMLAMLDVSDDIEPE